MINGVEYDIVQGATFSEEYNETLDSGTIIITHVNKIEDLKPYDDVYIYSNSGSFKGYPFPENEQDRDEPYFYKHLLVDQFTEEMINIDEDFDDQNFRYTIQLFSETKKLETVQLPNISVTQPLNYAKKRSIWDYLVSFVNMYSPLLKVQVSANSDIWTYEKKYTVASELEDIFGDTFSPDFVMNTPNLRDLLSKLMIVKDRIPYVKDDVIYAMDITARNGSFNSTGVNFITGTMSSDSYCDNLKRNYTEALSQDNSARLVEYLGFRNNNESLLKLSNMCIETRFPIYKVNKMYLCYYKKISVILDGDTENEKTMAFLCKQDITPLVKLNSERNLLSENWAEFNNISINSDINTFAHFKMITVGYDIGSKKIIGWGETYDYPIYSGFWDVTKSYVQNILRILETNTPFGIDSFSGVVNKIKETFPNAVDISVKASGTINYEDVVSNIVSSYGADTYPDFLRAYIPDTLPLKSLFFQIDYNAFYSGAVIQSKDDSRDDIVIGDNQSSSLTLLEQDGIAQKEKANRFANKTLRLNARYDGDYKNLQALGSVFSNKSYDDIVIYHREYSIWDNMISAVYYGSKDYVLKNYFTSVFARYRTYNLMSYGESTNRAENKRMLLCFSKNNYELELENKQFALTNFDNFYSKFLSGLKPAKDPYNDVDKINYGFIRFDEPQDEIFGSYFETSIDISTQSGETYNGEINLNFTVEEHFDKNNSFSNFNVSNISKRFSYGSGAITINSNNFSMDEEGNVQGKINFSYVGGSQATIIFTVYYNYENKGKNKKFFGSDINIFNSGLALCFNIKMFDNVSSGVFVNKPNPNFGLQQNNVEQWFTKVFKIQNNQLSNALSLLNPIDAQVQVSGSEQKWLITIDDTETGFADTLGFYICHVDSDDYFAANKAVLATDVYNNNMVDENQNPIDDKYKYGYYSKILKLPQIDINDDESENNDGILINNVLGKQYEISKDNKECVDMTFEIETYSDNKDVIISPMLLQLSDLLGNYKCFASEQKYSYADAIIDNNEYKFAGGIDIITYTTTIGQAHRDYENRNYFIEYTMPLMIFEIPTSILSNLMAEEVVYINQNFNYPNFNLYGCCTKDIMGEKKPFDIDDEGCRQFASNDNSWYVNGCLTRGSIVNYSFNANYINNISLNNGTYSFDVVGVESFNVCTGSGRNGKPILEPQGGLKTMHFKGVNNLEDFNITGTHPESGSLWFVNLEKTIKVAAMPNNPNSYVEKEISVIAPISGNEIIYFGGQTKPEFVQYRFTNGNNQYVDAIFYKGTSNQENDYYEDYFNNSYLNSYKTIPLSNKNISKLIYTTSFMEFPQNMFIVYSNKKIDKTNMYDQLLSLSNDNSDIKGVDGFISIESRPLNEIIFVSENNYPYISINLAYLPSEANSIQYWFYDTYETNAEGVPINPTSHSNSYRFVFGVNVTDADRNVGEIKVYLSLTSTKDNRIYDAMHNVIGKNHNYYYNKNDKVYGINQYFDSVNDYFVKFEPNFAETSDSNEVRVMEAQTFTKGIPQALSTCTLNRPGYHFVGWSKEASPEQNDTIDFEDGETVMFDRNVTLYAIWESTVPEQPDGYVSYSEVTQGLAITVKIQNPNSFVCKAYYSIEGANGYIQPETYIGIIPANGIIGPSIQTTLSSYLPEELENYTLYLKNAADETKISSITKEIWQANSPEGNITYTYMEQARRYAFSINSITNTNPFSCKAYYSVEGQFGQIMVSKTYIANIGAGMTYGPQLGAIIISYDIPASYTIIFEDVNDDTKITSTTYDFSS